MSILNLKKELEAILLITKWSPSDKQIRQIAERLRLLGKSPRKSDIESIVLDVVGTYGAISLEGIDNSDLTALLLMATKVPPLNDQ